MAEEGGKGESSSSSSRRYRLGKETGPNDTGSGVQRHHRKLGAITKGRFSLAMDRIEVPTHNWFHSERKNSEIYYYDAGNFEAPPATDSGLVADFFVNQPHNIQYSS